MKDNFKSDKEYIEGGNLKMSPSYERMYELEEHFLKNAPSNIETSFDCTAYENPYFKTLNYTSYAGALIIHPLQPELSLIQTHEALLDNNKLPWKLDLQDRVKYQTGTKYLSGGRSYKGIDALVVLCGDNKLKSQVNPERLKLISEKHGGKVAFKTHPLTPQNVLDELKALTPDSPYLTSEYDLYACMKNVKTVYTTHISESAAFAQALGKEIQPIDKHDARTISSFSHINYHIFLNRDIDQIIGSYKSGIFDPRIDKNWKINMERYIEYIMTLRDTYRSVYI